jgi:hypothetical protein
MGFWKDLATDERNNWNAYMKKVTPSTIKPTSPWDTVNLIGNTLLFEGHAAASVVLETANAVGGLFAGASDVGDKNKKDKQDDGGSHNTNDTFSEQAVGKFDQYSNFYTNDHANTFIHPPDDNVTLYKYNNIPITTNGTQVFGHMTTDMGLTD